MKTFAKFILMIEALWLCLPFGSVFWSRDVNPTCRYLNHRLSVEGESEIGKIISCSRPGCSAYEPWCRERAREVRRFGFALS